MGYLSYFFTIVLISFFFFKKYDQIANFLKLIDNKNPNYSFKATPTGSGILFCLIFLIGNLFFFFEVENFKNIIPNRYYIFLISVILITLISFKDDIKPVDPILRLIFQFITVYLSTVTLDLISVPLPTKLLILLSLIIWIYIINISNFLDGSDGFLIIIYFFIIIDILILQYLLKINIFSYYLSLILLPVIIVFFIFNKPQAKIYMGDAGSIFLGFIGGFIFLEILLTRNIAFCFAVFAYPFVDCTLTLIKKLRKGYMPWVGLYDYYFLKPILKNKINHKNVLFFSIVYNLINTVNIILLIKFNLDFLCLVSYLLSIILIYIFNEMEGNLKKIKIF